MAKPNISIYFKHLSSQVYIDEFNWNNVRIMKEFLKELKACLLHENLMKIWMCVLVAKKCR